MAINYNDIVQTVIKEHANLHQSGYIPVETVFDTERQHYLLVQVGWANGHWIYGCIIHIDIINDKIYVQQNNTELAIAERLVELGVSKTDIVLGFHSPFKRQFTEYAVS